MIHVETKVEFEILSPETGRIWIVTECDGATYRTVHVSGPIDDVRDYYTGNISITVLQARFEKKTRFRR